MHPILFQLGPLSLRTYGVLVALGFLGALELAKFLGRRRGLPASFIQDLATLTVASGLVGARALYVLLNMDFFRSHPLDIFKIWEGGLVFYGGFLLAAPLAVWWIHRRGYPLGVAADVTAPALALGQAIGRWGCLAAGCCYGKPTPLPWAVVYKDPAALAPLGIGLHPTQLYEALGNLAIAGILSIGVLRRRGRPGVVFWTYVLLYAVLRYSVELFRGDERGAVVAGLYPSQWIAALAILVAGTVLAVQVEGHERA